MGTKKCCVWCELGCNFQRSNFSFNVESVTTFDFKLSNTRSVQFRNQSLCISSQLVIRRPPGGLYGVSYSACCVRFASHARGKLFRSFTSKNQMRMGINEARNYCLSLEVYDLVASRCCFSTAHIADLASSNSERRILNHSNIAKALTR